MLDKIHTYTLSCCSLSTFWIKHQCDLVYMFIVHHPHYPDDKTKSNKLHHRHEMDHHDSRPGLEPGLITLFILFKFTHITVL